MNCRSALGGLLQSFRSSIARRKAATRVEKIGLSTKISRSGDQFSGPESLIHIRFLADFITTTSESRFWVHTPPLYAASTKISANRSGISSITSWLHATS
jgi:hypothetical protein